MGSWNRSIKGISYLFSWFRKTKFLYPWSSIFIVREPCQRTALYDPQYNFCYSTLFLRWKSNRGLLTKQHGDGYPQVPASRCRPWAHKSPEHELPGFWKSHSLFSWRSAYRLWDQKQARKLVSYLQQRSTSCSCYGRGCGLSCTWFSDSISLLLRQWGTGDWCGTHAA